MVLCVVTLLSLLRKKNVVVCVVVVSEHVKVWLNLTINLSGLAGFLPLSAFSVPH